MMSHRLRRQLAPIAVFAIVFASGCGSSDETSTSTDSGATSSVTGSGNVVAVDTTQAVVPDATTGTIAVAATTDPGTSATDEATLWADVLQNAQWADNVNITVDGSTVMFESDGLPSHEYLDVYLADGRDGKYIAGGVEAYDARFEFPLVPTPADTPSATGNGAIGVAISGAVFFNPYEGDGTATVANDDNTTIDGVPFIDACGGHPLPNAISYHYHGIPFCITDAVDTEGEHSVLIGYLFDGYPIFGPQDVGGEEPTDLDECMGHFGPTPEFPDGIYHYHVSSQANYISECLTGN
jgi:YHYH protein